MPYELQNAVTETLTAAWAWRWFFIISVGALPVALAALFPLLKEKQRFRETKSALSLVGLILCILSGPMVLDTLAVELESPEAIAHVECQVVSVPEWRWKKLRCADETAYAVEQPLALEPGDFATIWYLPNTKLAVHAVRKTD